DGLAERSSDFTTRGVFRADAFTDRSSGAMVGLFPWTYRVLRKTCLPTSGPGGLGLVNTHRLVRAVERESRHLDVETAAIFGFHLVSSGHDARRRGQRRAAGVLETFTRLQHRLLADHARAPHLLQPAERIGDAP